MIRAALASTVVLFAATWLLATGTHKLLDLSEFARVVESHRLVPTSWIPSLALLVSLGEILVSVAAIWLVAALKRNSLASLLLGCVFAALALYLVPIAMAPPTGASCGCGLGREPVHSWWSLVARNALIGAGLLAIACACSSRLR